MPPQASSWNRAITAAPVVTRAIEPSGNDTFCFGDFRLMARERVLLRGDRPVSVGGRAFDVLLALVERAGETVNRQELFHRVWPDVIVTKVNLRVHVAGLRKALGERQDGNRFIVSIAGRGYRFVAPVSRSPVRLERVFGRDASIAALSSQLARRRFICLGGPGGWGHTTVAFAIARILVTDFDTAVSFVDLAGIDNPADVPKALAAALGCDSEAREPLTGLLAYLRPRPMLLVFDNCDPVLAGVLQLTDRLFAEAPLVHIVISSREALHLSPAS